MRAIREHLRDFIAIVALVAAGLVTAYVILNSQAAALPSWVPLLGEDRFELKAEFSSAQAVTPGQGQAVNIAGVQVGDITGVELTDGQAEVTMEIDYEYADLINDDASLLLRPKTGLNDMVIEVDPGVSGTKVEEGSSLPSSSTLPNVNPDEVLASLDADSRAFLKLLLANGAQALDPAKGRDLKLSAALRQLEPFARDIARINGLLAQRRENVARSITNFRLLSDELADKDEDLVRFVDSSDEVLGRFAAQEASIRAALREFPGTLSATRAALKAGTAFANNARPAIRDSLPGARALAPALRALRPLFRETAGPIRDQIRPFTVEIQPTLRSLRSASKGLGTTVPALNTSFDRLNEGLDALAANPEGTDESYLFFVPWLNHNTNSSFTLQDAHGPIRRGIVLETCNTATAAGPTFEARPFLDLAANLTRLPDLEELPC